MNVEIVKDDTIAGVILTTPVISDSKRITKYYANANASLLRFLQKKQLNVPVEVKINITHNSDMILSLYRDIYIGTNFARIGDTWVNGYPASLKSLGFKRNEMIKKCVEEADTLQRSGYVSLFHNYPKLIHKKFRPECFYIQDGYPVIFYQPGILAGKSHGVISFKSDLLFELKL